MHESSKMMRSFVFLLCSCLLLVSVGCGDGSGSSSGITVSNPTGSGAGLGKIYGFVRSDMQLRSLNNRAAVSENISIPHHNLRSNTTEGQFPVKYAKVSLESDPTVSTITDANGAFFLEGIPAGRHTLVAYFKDHVGQEFKARSANEVELSLAEQINIDMKLDPAITRVKGKLLTADGEPIKTGTRLMIGGEFFFSEIDGNFETPLLPESYRNLPLLVFVEGRPDPFEVPLTVTDNDLHSRIETRLPITNDGYSVPNNWQPPIVSLHPELYGKFTTSIKSGEKLIITARPSPGNSLSSLTLQWFSSMGDLEDTAHPYSKIFSSKSGGIAEITVVVSDHSGVSGSIVLPIRIEGVFSSENQLTTFLFNNPAVSGTIDQDDSTIFVKVPYGTDVTSLVAHFSASANANVKIGSVTQLSGVTVNNFSSPLSYTVYAQNGQQRSYLVTLEVELRVFVKYDGNGNTGGAVPVDNYQYQEADLVTVRGNFGGLTIDNYYFNGWNSRADGTGTTYRESDSFSIGNQDVTLFADWKPKYVFASEFGEFGAGPGQFKYPWGVTFNKNGDFVVADRYNNRIQMFSFDGTFIRQWGSGGSGDGQFNRPISVACDKDNNVYVLDYNNNRVQKFDEMGNFISKWGSSGSGNGQFSYPYDIAVDRNNNVIVVDSSNNRIQKFDENGNFISVFGQNLGMQYPYAVTFDLDHNILVADSNNFRVLKFNEDGTFIRELFEIRGDSWGIAVNSAGQIITPSYYTNRIAVHDADGRQLYELTGVTKICGVAVYGNTLIGADYDNSRILRFVMP